jgi:hypothetical protein
MKTDKDYYVAKEDVPNPANPSAICARKGETVRPRYMAGYGFSREDLDTDPRFDKLFLSDCSCQAGEERSFKYISEEDMVRAPDGFNQEIVHVTHCKCNECGGYFRTITK